jgi:AcrR family transcriptional regulator
MTVAERRRREREQRRHRILDAAQRVMTDKGPSELTVDDVAAAAELGKGTLYLYFQSKEDLVLGVALRNQAKLLERMREAAHGTRSGAQELERVLTAHLQFMRREHSCLGAMMQSLCAGRPPPFSQTTAGWKDHVAHIQATFETVRAAVERGRSDGSLRLDLDPKTTALHLWAANMGALVLELQSERLRQAGLPSADEPADQVPAMIALLLQGVRRSTSPSPSIDDEAHAT